MVRQEENLDMEPRTYLISTAITGTKVIVAVVVLVVVIGGVLYFMRGRTGW
jgi:hypothetical protein